MNNILPSGETRTSTPPRNPADVLMIVLINLLAPLFLDGSGGDVRFACLAARATVEDYRATSRMDLLSVAQIIAFGLGALGSLGLSMMDNLDVRLILRLRSNAVSLNRAAEQNRRTLERSQAAATYGQAEGTCDDAHDLEMLETLRQTEILFAESRRRRAAQTNETVADDPILADDAVGAAASTAAVSRSSSTAAIDQSADADASGATPAAATLQDMPADAAGRAMALEQWQHQTRAAAMRQAEADHAAEIAAQASSEVSAHASQPQPDITSRIAALSSQANALLRGAPNLTPVGSRDMAGPADTD